MILRSLRRLLLALLTFWTLALGSQAMAADQDFYWKASYGRGAGAIPDLVCPPGKNKVGELCYDQCRDGYRVSGLSCARPCPSGYEDRGPTCHWQGSLSYTPELKWDNCATRSKRTCTDFGALGKSCTGGDCLGGLKANCRDGYKDVAGTCWFDGKVPSGFSGTNLDPIKPAYPLPNPRAMVQVCKPGKNLTEALCYEPCRRGYSGVGPVCWANVPPKYVDCFAGYAKSPETCGMVIGNQTLAAGTIAMLAVGPALKAKMAATLAKYKQSQIDKAVGASPDIAKAILSNSDDVGRLTKELAEAVGNGSFFKVSESCFDVTKKVFGGTTGNKIFAAMRTGGFIKAQSGNNANEYFNVDSKEEAFARTRDAMAFLALGLSIYGLSIPPAPTPSPVDVTVALFDVLSAFMYTVYGE